MGRALAAGDTVAGAACEAAPSNCAHGRAGAFLRGLRRLLDTSGLDIGGRSLKRAPHGYDEGHPAIDLIRLKNWEMLTPIPDSTAADEEKLLDAVADTVARCEPLRQFFLSAAQQRPSQKQTFEDFYSFYFLLSLFGPYKATNRPGALVSRSPSRGQRKIPAGSHVLPAAFRAARPSSRFSAGVGAPGTHRPLPLRLCRPRLRGCSF